LRKYSITSIFRNKYREYDSNLKDDNMITKISIDVSQQWEVYTSNDGKIYNSKSIETIKINWAHIGFIRYYYTGDDDSINANALDRHYIAFNTNIKMDKLLNVKFEYDYEYKAMGSDYYYNNKIESISCNEKVTTESPLFYMNWFKDIYTWNRIQTIDDFIDENKDFLTYEETKYYSQGSWVLNYAEFNYIRNFESFFDGIEETTKTNIISFNFLEFTFIKDGETYTLGVVSDIFIPSEEPDFSVDTNNLDEILEKLVTLLGILVLIMFLYPIINLLLNLIIKFIKLLFKIPKYIFKKKNRKE